MNNELFGYFRINDCVAKYNLILPISSTILSFFLAFSWHILFYIKKEIHHQKMFPKMQEES